MTLSIAALKSAVEKMTAGDWVVSNVMGGHPNAIVADTANICGMHDGGHTRESIDGNCRGIVALKNAADTMIAVVEAVMKRPWRDGDGCLGCGSYKGHADRCRWSGLDAAIKDIVA